MVCPVFGPKIGEDKKKRSLPSKWWVFGPEICEFQNKKRKRSSPLIWLVFSSNEDGKKIFTTNQWRYRFTSYYGVTPKWWHLGRAAPPSSDATDCNIDKCRLLANYLLFCLQSQKWGICIVLLNCTVLTEVKLRFNLVPNCRSATALRLKNEKN